VARFGGGSLMDDAALRAALAELGLGWNGIEHDAVFTVEESLAIHDALPGAHTKNLFLKDSGGQFWLVTADHAKRVDLKALAGAIGAKKLSFGKAEDMEALLGVTPGSVTPLAAINDAGGQVRVVLDADLAAAAMVYVHPLRNTATIGLSGADLLRALAAWHHEALVAAIPERA
jgi:Ala-tRNA(Pro) deacylase